MQLLNGKIFSHLNQPYIWNLHFSNNENSCKKSTSAVQSYLIQSALTYNAFLWIDTAIINSIKLKESQKK